MFQNLTDRTKAAVFYALALSFSFALVPLAPILGERVAVITMFTSLLAVLLMLLVVTRDGYTRAGWAALGLHRAGFRAWGLALLVPFLVLGFTYSVVWMTGLGTFTVPAGSEPIGLLLDLVASIVIVSLFAFVEEIGWRSYLLPHLSSLGRGRALLLSGFLHGVWHLPILLLTPYYHSLGNPWIVAPLFLATLTLAGVLYGYLRLTTGSVWPATIAHGAYNAFWNKFTLMTVAASPVTLEYLAGESGVLPLIAIAVVAGYVGYRLSRRAPTVLATAAQNA
ncbi:MAG: type II CAAX prenyl endopeptidase Rce1 family protein [Roseiflexaceae bacterium]